MTGSPPRSARPVIMAGVRPPPVPPGSRTTSKVWYVVAGGMIVIALCLALTGFAQFMSTVEDMRRVAMPGKATIVLPSGPTTLYVERRSIVDGRVYEAPEGLAFGCGVTGPDGRPVALDRSASSVSYSFGAYEGYSAFDVHAAAAGEYVLACEAPSSFGVALGYGVGTWIVVGLVGGLVPGLAGLSTFIIVMIKRSRQKRRAAARAAGAAPGAGAT